MESILFNIELEEEAAIYMLRTYDTTKLLLDAKHMQQACPFVSRHWAISIQMVVINWAANMRIPDRCERICEVMFPKYKKHMLTDDCPCAILNNQYVYHKVRLLIEEVRLQYGHYSGRIA